MLRRQHHEGRAPQRVGPRGEYLNRRARFRHECDLRAIAAPNPVRLHHFHRLRPVDLFQVGQQLFTVVGDAELPLVQVFLDDRRVAAFAVAVLAPDLLARQRRVTVGTPVDRGKLPVGQAHLVQLEEEPLGPLVILRVTADRFAVPCPHRAHAPKLALHALDVPVCPLLGMHVILDGRILRRQTKCVKAHREEDVVAAHAVEAGGGIAGGHRVPVARVQVAGCVGQHGQRVPLRPVRVFDGIVQALFFPGCLPLGFDLAVRIPVRHIGNLLSRRINFGGSVDSQVCWEQKKRDTRKPCPRLCGSRSTSHVFSCARSGTGSASRSSPARAI